MYISTTTTTTFFFQTFVELHKYHATYLLLVCSLYKTQFDRRFNCLGNRFSRIFEYLATKFNRTTRSTKCAQSHFNGTISSVRFFNFLVISSNEQFNDETIIVKLQLKQLIDLRPLKTYYYITLKLISLQL